MTTKLSNSTAGAPARTQAEARERRGGKRGPAASEPNIGSRLRHTRIMRGLTLKDLAEMADCTQSFISKLENGRVNPSFAMLHRLAGALGVGMSQFLDDGETSTHPDVMVFPAGRRVRTVAQTDEKGAPSLMMESLSPPRGNWRLLEANLHHIMPGADTAGMLQGEGETFGYVLEGEVELILAGEATRLGPRDSFIFPSSLPHGYRNRGTVNAVVMWVNTPPNG